MKNISFLFFFQLLQACSSDNGLYKKSDSIINNLAKTNIAPWSKINNERSDYALLNKKTQSIFLFNSACRKNETSTLNTIASSILAEIEEVSILERKSSFYQNRDALETTVTGKADGVLRYLKIITIQKNNCIYDYILISTNKNNLESDTASFKMFLDRIILL